MNHRDQDTSADRDSMTGARGAQSVGEAPGPIVAGPAARAAAGTASEPSSRAASDRPTEKGAARAVDPARERAYWSENFSGRSYVKEGSSFDDYGPAYGFGVDARGRYPGRSFDDVEAEMSIDWPTGRGESSLTWGRARHAARDAWNRISAAQTL